MVMAGTRMIGTDSGGYPAQPDADNIIRTVDNTLLEAMDLNVPLLELCGGLDGFTVNTFKHAWPVNDAWRRRITTHGGLAATDTATWTITGQAHRYPIGTLFKLEDELVRIIAIGDANTVTVKRGAQGTTPAIHASTVVAESAGSSVHEGDNWIYRPTPTISLPYNYCQMDHASLRETWRRHDTNMYGINGAEELSRNTLDTLKQKTVMIESALVRGRRYAGAADDPASAGGMEYFITSANGAYVLDKSGAAFVEADIHNAIRSIADTYGRENIPTTIVMDTWSKLKMDSFYSGSRRLTRNEKVGGSRIDTLDTEWGMLNLTMNPHLPAGNIYGIMPANVEIGHHGATGLLHVGDVPQIQAGPFNGTYVYCDFTFRFRKIWTMFRIYNFSTTS